MGNIGGMEIGLILILVLVVIGPERLPGYAAQIGRLVRELRAMAKGATSQLKAEMGDDFEELRQFDPRQYDPRRIVREALADDPPASAARAQATSAARARAAGARTAGAGAMGAAAAAPAEPAGPAGTREDFAVRHADGIARTTGDRPVPFDDEAT
ncbi:twin-arginine translocase TatA/TatE family subunit [Serinibacter salmoneus]|uniref:Sec-independent protein translocase protein TatB n=1 Tax=Serinibacter salmoneus TaxID=556530 RepID=A0A2A9CXI3_9MICO|nr:twin-arginine translocase TatA/TatE family subunit [Serinibacter salmoneus]PFG19113.1 sec-independent protein translocase protein TatB [Serinibacter salmoneus]